LTAASCPKKDFYKAAKKATKKAAKKLAKKPPKKAHCHIHYTHANQKKNFLKHIPEPVLLLY